MEIEDNYFNIVAYEKNANSDGSLTIDVECEHISYDLLNDDNTLESFTSYGTPAQIMAELFQGTPFTVGTVEITTEDYISINEAITKRGVLINIAKVFGGELKFDKYQVSLLNRRGADRGVRFMYRKNLINCKYAVDSREKVNGLPKISVEVDVAELEFAGMPDEHYELGDDVTVIHGPLQVNIPERIVSMEYNPLNRMQGRVSIGNRIKDITDTIVNLQQKTVAKDRVYNGCKIGPEEGFVATRSDNKVKSILNATEGISVQKGDGSGSSWTNMFYVDTSGNIHMNNAYIELIGALATILLNPDIGIKISNQNGDMFYIDSATGKLKLAGDAEFSGEVKGATITGSSMFGGKFSNTSETGWITIDQTGGNVADFNFNVDTASQPLLTLYNEITALVMRAFGVAFLNTNGDQTYLSGNWDFSDGALRVNNVSGSFTTQDGKSITVINGIVTSIS